MYKHVNIGDKRHALFALYEEKRLFFKHREKKELSYPALRWILSNFSYTFLH